jgi:hypothetical protein
LEGLEDGRREVDRTEAGKREGKEDGVPEGPIDTKVGLTLIVGDPLALCNGTAEGIPVNGDEDGPTLGSSDGFTDGLEIGANDG